MNTTFAVITIGAVNTWSGSCHNSYIPLQQAEARPNSAVKSCDNAGSAFNDSKGRCFNP